jgi:Plant transposon protein
VEKLPEGVARILCLKGKKPTIVLEAVCDYNLWFRNAFYGSGGAFNDLNVPALSNLVKMIVDGMMHTLEKAAGTVPNIISGKVFDRMFHLVDGIYPQYSRFVPGVKDPLTPDDKSFTAWQEAASKDIERAFGVLQARFHWVASPIKMFEEVDIAKRMKTCLILRNMGVSDRVMDSGADDAYIPSYRKNDVADNDNDQHDDEEEIVIVGPLQQEAEDLVTQINRWRVLKDTEEHHRLSTALKNHWKCKT